MCCVGNGACLLLYADHTLVERRRVSVEGLALPVAVVLNKLANNLRLPEESSRQHVDHVRLLVQEVA